MRSFAWLLWLEKKFLGGQRYEAVRGAHKRFVPRLEILEDRTVPTVYNASTAAALLADISTANANGQSSNTIVLSDAIYNYSTPNNDWYGPNALPAISSSLVIQGNGATISATTSASNPFRLFYVSGGLSGLAAGSLTLQNLTLQGGLAEGGNSYNGGGGLGAGGAIFNQGTLVISGVTLTGNEALGGSGGVGSSSNDGGGGIGQGAQGAVGGGFGSLFTSTSYGGSGSAGTNNDGGGGGGFQVGAGNATGANGGGQSGLGGSGSSGGAGGDGGGGGLGGGLGGGFGFGVGGGGGGGVGGGGTARGRRRLRRRRRRRQCRTTRAAATGGFGGGGGGIWQRRLRLAVAASAAAWQQQRRGRRRRAREWAAAHFQHVPARPPSPIRPWPPTLRQGGSGALGGRGLGAAIFNLDGALSLFDTTVGDNTVVAGTGSANGTVNGGAIYSVAYGNALTGSAGQTANVALTNSILAGSSNAVSDVVSDREDTSGKAFTNTASVNATLNGGAATNLEQNGAVAIVNNAAPTSISGQFIVGNPLLRRALAFNGGPTATLAISTVSSPAFNLRGL